MTKHTSGPWKRVDAIGPAGECLFERIEATDGKIIASTWAGSHRANARLIAAAPDLLEHLKHMVWLVETELKEDGGHIVQGAKDAIVKASE